ncbi:RNase H family protein [Propionibacteriaceae bacterium Y1923]
MITAAADGSALSNPGPTGWAWYIDDDRWAAGGWPHGTNNMGELMAVLDLLNQTAGLQEPLRVLCDSQYAINAITKWTPGWKRRGWRKADGKPVLNVELLTQLDRAMQGRDVSFEWVKGHSGHDLNEKADELARAAATAHRDGRPVPHGPGFTGAPPAAALDVRPGQQLDDDLFSVMPAPADEDEPPLRSVDEAPADGVPTDEVPEVDATSQVVVALVERTRELLDNTTRSSPERLARLLHPDLVRHDGAGRVQTYRRLLQGLDPIEVSPHLEVLGIDELADDVAVLRWRLTLGHRRLLVASTWQRGVGGQRRPDGWLLRLEQVTPVL